MQRFGAIPIDRSGSLGLVKQLVEQMKTRDEMRLLLSPEGTRLRGERWKSGFYHLAREAGVPICLSYLDYARRRGGFGPCFQPTGNFRADMDLVRAFYADVKGRLPEQFTPPLLAEESEAPKPA
jgi:1-acyl-sn-glycerol-3-phosphate acyltransferase